MATNPQYHSSATEAPNRFLKTTNSHITYPISANLIANFRKEVLLERCSRFNDTLSWNLGTAQIYIMINWPFQWLNHHQFERYLSADASIMSG